MRDRLRWRIQATAFGIFAAILPMGTAPAVALGEPVFINEIHYDNTGADADEAIEIAGPAGTDLSGWSLVLYNGNGGAPYGTLPLSGTIPNQASGFGTVSVPAVGLQNGSPDGIALVNASSVAVQFLSYEGTLTAVAGPANGMTSTDIGVSQNGSEPMGQSLQLSGTGSVNGDFAWLAPAAASFGAVNTGQIFVVVLNAPVVATCANASTLEGSVIAAGVSATDADGTVTDLAITGITPTDPGTITLTDEVAATVVGGQATANVSASATTPAGIYTVAITATNDDATPQTGTCNVTVTVQDLLTIGEVQGSVGDTANGLTHRSPFAPPSGNAAGATVFVQGVITQKTLARTSTGANQNGFFLQNTPATADSDPNSSDGIFVFMGGFNDLIGGYVPVVGDEVIIRARVTEFFSLTQFTSASAVSVVRSGVDVSDEIPAPTTTPPSDLAAAGRYWERLEGMQVTVPERSVVLNGRNVFPSTLDGEVWVAGPDTTIARRRTAYTNRSFRDPHPLDDVNPALFDNGNGYRIIMGSLGIKATLGDNSALIAPSRTFDRMDESATGGVYFSFNKYQIQVTEQLDLDSGRDPDDNGTLRGFDRDVKYSVVTYNMENLYDFVDDPNDGCDFVGNSGCPGVNPPFDYVPASQAVYDQKLADLARQIVSDLRSPDVILVQEIEDQDIDGDGLIDALEDLAAAITAIRGPQYRGVHDPDGADDRGITAAFLYRTNRVELLPADPNDVVLGDSPTIDYRGAPFASNEDVQNPKTLNADLPDDVDLSTGFDGTNVFTRAPQVGKFRVWRDGIGESVFVDLYLVSNHFSSTPNARVGQRTEQALYNAAIVGALQAFDPGVRVIVGGDFNVYPRPDDAFSPGQPLFPSDQLAPLYEAGLTNLWDKLVKIRAASAYSYVFEGQAQTLDQLFLTPSVVSEFVTAAAAHINADWPADFGGDRARGISDHDPQISVLRIEPTIQGIRDLVMWLAAAGEITDQATVASLLQKLDRIDDLFEMRRFSQARKEMNSFIQLVRAASPQKLSFDAEDALVQEAREWLDDDDDDDDDDD